MASRKIENLDSRIQPYVREFLKQAKFGKWQAFITDGYRSNEEQNELYEQGRSKSGNIVTNARGGQSNHNKGLAIDIAFVNIEDKNQVSWDAALYEKAAEVAKGLGFSWGGDWRNINLVDKPHFEMLNPKPFKSMILSNVKIFKDKNGPTIYFALPVKSDSSLESYAENFGIEIPKTTDEKIDWEKVESELIAGRVDLS